MTSSVRALRAVAAAALGAALLVPLSGAAAAPVRGADDAVVVAVIDGSFTPYHWDFVASRMPQHLNRDPSDNIPLKQPPHTYLPGFPKPSKFARYAPLPLTLSPNDEDLSPAELDQEDAALWEDFGVSKREAVDYRWIPDSKIIGALSFGGESRAPGTRFHAASNAHGMGTSSVSIGNLYGTCPECLVVMIQYSDAASGEEAIQWAQDQPWIDLITNSYGFSQVERERIYNGSDVSAQQRATERGQPSFFSSGNGISNTFTIPNSTLTSSQEGPDWIITVGATDPSDDDNYTGTGKPADIAGIGTGYPSAYTAKNQSGGGKFGGTSNATPTIAGTYARALYYARRAMAGRSRVQANGVISVGRASCGRTRPKCEIGDGKLTERELRLRLFRGAFATAGNIDPLSQGVASAPGFADARFLSEGHGTYRGRVKGDEAWNEEFRTRLLLPLIGGAYSPKRPTGETDYMRVDSFCRQHIWGEWTGGYYTGDEATPLPDPDPAYPMRTEYHQRCQQMTQPPPE